jgi:antitoxin (DNA-binding transcriptional repressor) of toxin-antitoxin stability system
VETDLHAQAQRNRSCRRFSEVLDAVVDHGESLLILRCGRAVARMGPAASARGAHVKALLSSRTPDEAWSGELRERRSLVEPE